MGTVLQKRWRAECGAKGRWCDANEPPARSGSQNGGHRHLQRCQPCQEMREGYWKSGQFLTHPVVYEERLVDEEFATRNYRPLPPVDSAPCVTEWRDRTGHTCTVHAEGACPTETGEACLYEPCAEERAGGQCYGSSPFATPNGPCDCDLCECLPGKGHQNAEVADRG